MSMQRKAPQGQAAIELHDRQVLQRRNKKDGLSGRVREEVALHLGTGAVSMKWLAGHLSMSVATLRRQGIQVQNVKKASRKSGKKITEKDITIFTRQLAVMMKAGVLRPTRLVSLRRLNLQRIETGNGGELHIGAMTTLGELERSALVELDELAHMVVRGRPVPHWEGGDEAASFQHYLLAIRNAGLLGRNFAEAGFHTVIAGVLEGPGELDALLDHLVGLEVYFVRLLPALAEVLRRDEARAPDERMGDRSRQLYEIFSANGEFRGLRLDSTELNPDETARLILDLLDEARVL